MSRVFRLFLGLVLALCVATPAAAEPPIWRIKGRGGAEVVLFGSVHLLAAGDDWRSPALRRAIAEADQVWFEVDVDPATRAAGAKAAQAKAELPRGRTLSSLLDVETRARLERAARAGGLTAGQLERFEPWYVELMISLADLAKRGAEQGLGVEEQISALVPATTPRRAFETPAAQIAMIADQPLAEQAAMLAQTLKEMEEDPDAFARLQTAWLAGDLGFIEREAILPMREAAPGLYRTLVVDRNRRWANQIAGLLRGADQALIVVGVGHLIGPDSVPAMLRRRGLAVEGP